MPKLKPFKLNKGLTIPKPLALTIHLVLAAAGSGAVYYLVSQHEQQHQQQQLDVFAKQASTLIERHAQNWQQQASLLAQQPMLRSGALLKAVVPLEGTVPPSLNYADQDLLNRTRVAATQPEISGTGDKAVVSTALAMPTGGYAIFEWPIAPLVNDLQALTPPDIELKFLQQLGDGTPLEVLRIHASGNDGALRTIPLTHKGWQLAIQSNQNTGGLPLWAGLLSLLASLIPLLMWGLRQSATFVPSKIISPTPLDNNFDPAYSQTNTLGSTVSPVLSSKSLAALDTDVASGTEGKTTGLDSDQFSPSDLENTNPSASATENAEQDGGNQDAGRRDALDFNAENAANATASAAFDELHLLEEQPEAIDPHGDALEFNLDETLLPNIEFNLGASQFPAHLFRAYDIRGAIDDLNSELVGKIGRALATQLRQQDQYQVVVGYDARTSSSGYARLIREACVASGLTVIDIGRVSTPLCYFAAARHDGNAIMVTASHNPAHENGMKWLIAHQSPSPEAIQQIKQRVINQDFVDGLGVMDSQSYLDDYLSLLQDDVILSQPVRISIDPMHGSAGEIALAAFSAAGCEVSSLNIEPNGMFTNGAPDPSKPENLQELSNDIVISGSQIGFAFDGDGDRLVVMDQQGQIISPDYLISLFAKICLDSNPGSDILFDVKCSRMVSSIVSTEGGRPVMIRTGNTFLRQALRDPDYQAVFAGEFSGHYFFNDGRGHGQDDGIYAALRLLEWLDNRGQTLEEVLAELPVRVSTADLYLPLDDSTASEILEAFATNAATIDNAKISTIDGIRLDFNYGFGIIRGSNTGNHLTARFDADTAENLRLIRNTFARLLGEHNPRLAELILE